MTQKPKTSWKSTVLATLIAGGIGTYAWDLRKEHTATAKALSESELKASRLESAHKKLVSCTSAMEAQASECAAVEKMIGEMRGNLTTTKAELELLRAQRKESAARLAAFQDLTERFRKMIDSGKLEVVIRDGRMIVQLPAGVLFDSGSAELSREGELALMEVAIVLRHFADRKFMVEGHTDNRPLESAGETTRYRNNWELSTARAITVVEFLIEARMKAENLLAAGHGEFDPVGDNGTPGGRQQNRRIEIVLLPNVEELPAMPEAKTPG
jgi:chemotaxis protein MotB